MASRPFAKSTLTFIFFLTSIWRKTIHSIAAIHCVAAHKQHQRENSYGNQEKGSEEGSQEGTREEGRKEGSQEGCKEGRQESCKEVVTGSLHLRQHIRGTRKRSPKCLIANIHKPFRNATKNPRHLRIPSHVLSHIAIFPRTQYPYIR